MSKANKNLYAVHDEYAEQLKFMNFLSFAEVILGGVADREIHQPEIDRADPRNCILISCSTNLDPHGRKNHWVPAFFQEYLGPDNFRELTDIAKSETYSYLQKRIVERETLVAQKEGLVEPYGIAVVDSQISDIDADIELLLGMLCWGRAHKH